MIGSIPQRSEDLKGGLTWGDLRAGLMTSSEKGMLCRPHFFSEHPPTHTQPWLCLGIPAPYIMLNR